MPIDEQTIAELRALYEKAGSGEVFVYRDEDGFAIALADHLHRRDIAKFGVPYRKITRDWIEGHASLLEGLLNALPALLTAASNEARLQHLYDGQQDLIEDQARKLHAAQMEVEALRAIPALGSLVQVNDSCRYYSDWRGVALTVIAVNLSPDGDVYVTTAESDGLTRHGKWNNPTDGWALSDLSPAALTPPAASEEDAS